MAAHNWRSLRVRAAEKGIGSLMALPTMHTVLDMIEQLGLEAATAGVKTENDARSKISGYYDKLYKPDPTTIALNGGVAGPPPGFSDDEVEASFDAFLSAGGG
jgi:hypothetical protein